MKFFANLGAGYRRGGGAKVGLKFLKIFQLFFEADQNGAVVFCLTVFSTHK